MEDVTRNILRPSGPELLRGSGSMLPHKIFKIRSLEMHFPAFWGRNFLFSQPYIMQTKEVKKRMHCCEKREIHDRSALSCTLNYLALHSLHHRSHGFKSSS